MRAIENNEGASSFLGKEESQRHTYVIIIVQRNETKTNDKKQKKKKKNRLTLRAVSPREAERKLLKLSITAISDKINIFI